MLQTFFAYISFKADKKKENIKIRKQLALYYCIYDEQIADQLFVTFTAVCLISPKRLPKTQTFIKIEYLSSSSTIPQRNVWIRNKSSLLSKPSNLSCTKCLISAHNLPIMSPSAFAENFWSATMQVPI